MIIIFVEFIDQLIDYPINRASLSGHSLQVPHWGTSNVYPECMCVFLAIWEKKLSDNYYQNFLLNKYSGSFTIGLQNY